MALKPDPEKTEAFKTWCWKRALKMPLTERVPNDEISNRVDERRFLIKTIAERNWFVT